MAGLNKVMIIGNVGRDPEMRYTPAGQAVTSFSVAVSRRWSGGESGEAREETEWFNVVAWAKLAEQCNQLITKGRRVYIEGRLQTRSWDDKESGQKRYRTEVIASVMLLLDSRPPGGGGGSGNRDDSGFPTDEVEPDDIPF
jgi:single-strand DNA-binding protein